MGDDPARYLAGQARRMHDVPEQPDRDDVLRVLGERGARVKWNPRLKRGGYRVGGDNPFIALHPDATARDTAHELFHEWTIDNVRYGIDYSHPDLLILDPEAAADRFAAELCPDAERDGRCG